MIHGRATLVGFLHDVRLIVRQLWVFFQQGFQVRGRAAIGGVGLRGLHEGGRGFLQVPEGLVRQPQILEGVGASRVDLGGVLEDWNSGLRVPDLNQTEPEIIVYKIPGVPGFRFVGQGRAVEDHRSRVVPYLFPQGTVLQIDQGHLFEIVFNGLPAVEVVDGLLDPALARVQCREAFKCGGVGAIFGELFEIHGLKFLSGDRFSFGCLADFVSECQGHTHTNVHR